MHDPILRSMVVHSREMLAELFRCAVVQQGRQSGQPTRERSSVMMSVDCLAAPSADASNGVRPGNTPLVIFSPASDCNDLTACVSTSAGP